MLKKIAKRLLKIILWTIVSLIALYLLIITLLFVPPIQHFVLSKVSNLLTNITGGEITMDRVYLSPTFVLTAKNFAIKDHHYNNMIFATTLKGRINFTKTSKAQVTLSFAELDDGEVVLRKYAGEENVNIAIWARGFKKTEKRDPNFKLLFENIALNDVRFVYINDDKRLHKTDNTIDYAFFELQHIHLNVDDFLVFGPDISCKINSLTLSQYTGFEISSFTGNFRIYRQGLLLDHLNFTTPNSTFAGNFAFRYADFPDYSDFVNKVIFDTEVKSTSLAMQDVIYFAPALKGMDNQFVFSGYVGGPVNHLQTKDIYLTYKLQTRISGNFAIENLLDFKNSTFDFYVRDAIVNLSELAQFKLPKGKTITLPDAIKTITNSRLNGIFKGSMANFNTELLAQTNVGTVEVKMKTTPNSYSGAIACNNVNIACLLNQPKYLNKVSLKSTFRGDLDQTKNLKDALAATLINMQGKITHVDVFGYPLKGVDFDGSYTQKQITLALSSADSVASFNLKGNLNFTREVPLLNVALTYTDIKLYEFFSHFPYQVTATSKGFDRMIYQLQQIPHLALAFDSITMAMSGTRFENFNGFAGIDNARLTNKETTSRIDWFRLTAINKPNLPTQYQIHSNAVNVAFKTNYDLKDIVATVKNAAHYYLPEIVDRNRTFAATQEVASTDSVQFIDLDVQFFYTRNLTNLLLPQLNLSSNSAVSIHLGKTRSEDTFNIFLSQISYGGIGRLNNLNAEGKMTDQQLLGIQLQCDSLTIFQKRGGNLTFSNIDIHTNSNREQIDFQTSWRNPKGISINELNKFNGLLLGDAAQNISLKITNSKLFLRESLWQFIGDGNTISFENGGLSFDHLVLSSNVGKMSVNGDISKNSDKECNIQLENFDMSLLNSLIARTGMTLGGEMSLTATITPNIDHFIADGKTFVRDFVFNEELLGDLFLDAKMLNDGKPHFYGGILSSGNNAIANVLDFNYADYLSMPNKIIALNGSFAVKERELRVRADMDTLRIGFLSPFLASFSDVVSGEASGHLEFIMNPDSLYFDGKVRVRNALLGIAPLNTVYYISDQEILFNREGILFNQVLIKDKFNNDATLSGFVHHNRFKDFKIDLSISTPRIMVLNTPRKMDTPFFGDGFVSGDVSISGDTRQLNFTSRNIKTLSGSTITFPLNSTSSVSSAQGIYFVQSAAAKEAPVVTTKQFSTALNFDFTFEVTRDADVRLELDPIDGTLKCKTSGRLHLTYNTNSGNMNLDGILSIVSGTFNMSLKNFFPRNFTIVEGGTISFAGPLTTAQINVRALYQKTASLTSLSSELNAIGRTDVHAYLNLGGNLMNPNPTFSFSFPRLTNEEQNTVFTVLDTTNHENGIRQFFSFVFLNTFLAVGSGMNDSPLSYATGIDMVSGILTSFISNQLNNVNIGINYIDGQSQDDDYTEYSVSAAVNLRNDRLLIETTLGYGATNLQNNFVGDLRISYWLNEARNWRIRFFYFNDINNLNSVTPPQGGGVGISYRHEFNNQKDFLESWTPKKKEKKEKKEKK
ncbi:MAG: translocation/assembly module TamB [Lentimicrobiaceae bacterium]|nr:translocation/assembly module TamB [Lentimicrobiaceae bacterium]